MQEVNIHPLYFIKHKIHLIVHLSQVTLIVQAIIDHRAIGHGRAGMAPQEQAGDDVRKM